MSSDKTKTVTRDEAREWGDTPAPCPDCSAETTRYSRGEDEYMVRPTRGAALSVWGDGSWWFECVCGWEIDGSQCGPQPTREKADPASVRMVRSLSDALDRAEKAERRPSEAAVRHDAERCLLMLLWDAIDGPQDGDAPGNRELRDNLITRVREKVAEVEADNARLRRALEGFGDQ